MQAQSLTTGHESFYIRLERIERNHSRQNAAGRATSRMRPPSKATRTRMPNIVAPRAKAPFIPKPTLISRLKCWSYGCLIGGVLTLAKTGFGDVDAMHGLAGFSAELLYSSIWVAYLFFFLVALAGVFGLRQRPAFAQFSIALGTTMLLGLL
ncbi:hypothetical protein AB9F26_05900 [Falsihalocynthiibacter sp. BN13B15]|uniref:hypothetical protein n=1 Tax=Falsihalocynthiibacter sp. BN13B15 TaxID=3240871 RepID=UPI00350EB226